MDDVSVIIVNYNTRELLADCIESIYHHTHGVDYEIIVVDNSSTDDSEGYIKSRFTTVKWINSGGNIGFGRANNLGAKSARGKYLFLLNSDTVLKNNAIWIFYDYMERYALKDRVGAIGSILLDINGNPNLSYGRFPSPKSEIAYLRSKLLGETKQGITNNMDVDYITGADLFMSRDLFVSLMGFDSRFFMYYEETDLQYRMMQKGWKRRIICGLEIIHLEGGSFQKVGLTPTRFEMAQLSYNYYINKHFSGIKFVLFRISIMLIRLTLFFNKGWKFEDKLKAYWLVISRKERKD